MRFVNDHDVRRPGANRLEILGQHVVVGDLAKSRLCILRLPDRTRAADDLGLAIGKLGYFPQPLMFERGRTNDQHALRAEVPRKQLRGSDRLDGFAQSHLIADQGATGTGCEQRPLGLIGVKIRLDQFFEPRAVSAPRVRRIDDPSPFRGVAGLRNEAERIFVASQIVAALLGTREKPFQFAEILPGQSPGGRSVE